VALITEVEQGRREIGPDSADALSAAVKEAA
jgi:hypothetical protein